MQVFKVSIVNIFDYFWSDPNMGKKKSINLYFNIQLSHKYCGQHLNEDKRYL